MASRAGGVLSAHGLPLFALLLLAGCAPPSQSTLRYILPPPPDTPRIEWLSTYASDDDFPKTDARRYREKLTGKTPNRLMAPSGIASDGEGKVFVGDIQAQNVMVFDLEAKTASYLLEKDSREPRQMTFDSRKRLYVADSKRRTVWVFSREGTQLRTYGNSEQLQRPLGVAVDEARKRVYVSDGIAHQVKVFDLDSGQLVATFGTGATTKGQGDIYNPAGLALAADGSLYVVEHLNARISIFNPDGTFRSAFGSRDASMSGFENPRAISIDSDGNLWIVDFRREAIRAFDSEGNLLFIHGGPMQSQMGFAAPAAIYIDPNDEIFIADFAAGRFSRWRYLSAAALARHPITDTDLKLIPEAPQ
jgi:DNA-binding beta-propeller fold protein YncE